MISIPATREIIAAQAESAAIANGLRNRFARSSSNCEYIPGETAAGASVGLILKSVEAGGDTSRNNSSAAGTCDSGAGNSTTRDTTVEGVGAITGASVR